MNEKDVKPMQGVIDEGVVDDGSTESTGKRRYDGCRKRLVRLRDGHQTGMRLCTEERAYFRDKAKIESNFVIILGDGCIKFLLQVLNIFW